MTSIGTPLLDHCGNCGYIVDVREAERRIFALGTGRMNAVGQQYEVAFPSRVSTISDVIAAPMIERAAEANIKPMADISDWLRAARAAEAKERERREVEKRADAEAAAAFKADAARRMPTWAKAVIVAELIEDQSDSMTDYFSSTTRRTVILAFSKHTRDLFPELRRAAALFQETAELATAPASAEHREKYSMGGGYYLKAGYRHSNGWQVSKRTLYAGSDSVPRGEWLEPVETKAPSEGNSGSGRMAIEKHSHSKHGFDMWICLLGERVSREEYDSLLTRAKAAGGWYSRAWHSTPAGFAFKSEDEANAFAAVGETATGETRSAPDLGDKLRAIADGMQADIDDRFRDRLANTPKRQRQAAESRLQGYHIQRAQQGLRALAACHDAGSVPSALSKVRTKAEALRLATSKIERSGGYYDAGVDTGEPSLSTPEALAFWQLLKPDPQIEAAESLRRKLDALRFANIPGYFPTPREIAETMLDHIEEAGEPKRILEPEGGSGSILEAARNRFPAAELVTYERHVSLQEVLSLKGFEIAGSDFLEAPQRSDFDAVIMNPPFERGQDIQHVKHAFGFLKPGGRLVAIMSAGTEFRNDNASFSFREWLQSMGGTIRRLPDGAFKSSGTGVATVIVTVDREGGA